MMILQFEKTVIASAPPAVLWNTLTNPDVMKQWMGDEEMDLKITTDWKINSPIIVKGFRHLKFENKGIVLDYQPCKLLQYSHLSSLSRLEDSPANYSILKFELRPLQDQTELRLTIDNFPTETIYKHLCFYWRTTIQRIKLFSEQQAELVK